MKKYYIYQIVQARVLLQCCPTAQITILIFYFVEKTKKNYMEYKNYDNKKKPT